MSGQEKVLLDLGSWIHDHEEAVYPTGKGLSYHQFLGGSTLSADQQVLYLSCMTNRWKAYASKE